MGCCETKCCSCWKDSGLLVARLLLGLMFLSHGLMKFGLLGGSAAAAGSLMWWAGLFEVLAGVLVTVGLFWHWSAGFGALHSLAIFVVGHSPLFNADAAWFPLANRGELALAYLAGFLTLAIVGYGRYSLDAFWCRSCCKSKETCCESECCDMPAEAAAPMAASAAPKRKSTKRKAAKRTSTKKRK